MNDNTKMICLLSDGNLSSSQISEIVGLSPRYVRKVMQRHNLPRLNEGARLGDKNHQFVSGRRIDLDGYVLITSPKNHPFARLRPYRNTKLIYEHRYLMEQHLGRYLLPEEVIDHKDGLTLHNDINNLRIFPNNGEHLRQTISGYPKKFSESGRKNIRLKHLHSLGLLPVDTYNLRKKRGDVRLRQILLAALQLGIDSPFLLGTTYWLKKIGIDNPSRSNLELALAQLMIRWEADLLQ